MIRRTAISLALTLVLGASVANATDKTVIIAPPFPDGGFYGHGCPASLPGGATTDYYSSFLFGNRFYFKDPLPVAAVIESIDLTLTGASTVPPTYLSVVLNQDFFVCGFSGPGAGYPLGSFLPQQTPLGGGGTCARTFNTYTIHAQYDNDAAVSFCSPYWHGQINSLTFLGDVEPFEYSLLSVTFHYTGDYTATGQILDGTAEETKAISEKTTTYAQVPLGLEFKIGIKGPTGDYIPAEYRLSPATMTGLPNQTLYPDNALLEYSRTVHEKQKTFRGVHLGTQALIVIPDDTKLPTFTFRLGVIDPGNLGNSDVQYDKMFAEWGNKRGIPPHILKGLVRQEGPFDPFSYRYEPISNTTGDRFIQRQLTTAPYSSYILATSAGLGQGALLTADDVAPRNSFVLERPDGSFTPITDADVCPAACVSSRQIFEANDAKQHWSDPKFVGSTDWWDAAHLKMLEFTAQTPLSASYGLMQTMYVRAMDLSWVTTDGRRNPALLFDTAQNTLVGGGSVAIGTLEFYKAYRACNTTNLAIDPDFADSAAYKSQIIDALNYYNHGNAHRNVTYGDDAWNYATRYAPSHPLSRIFP